ncbi:hypothetical protein VTO73DRAFT_14831 [Trametes versicolor]
MAVFGTRIPYFAPLVASLLITAVHSFVPAYPSNITISPGAEAHAVLQVNWASQSFFKTDAQIVLRRTQNPGLNHGALVHFNDSVAAAATVATTTPWVAFVSCDSNITDTNASEINIFARAEKLGAIAGVLYSLHSQTCYIQQSLEDPSQFDRGLDIFTLSSLTTMRLVNSTFMNIDAAQYGTFDAAKLDAAHDQVITPNGPTGSPFLIANTLLDSSGATDTLPDSSATASGASSGGATKTSSSGVSASATNSSTSSSSTSSGAPNSGVRFSVPFSSFISGLLCLLAYLLFL